MSLNPQPLVLPVRKSVEAYDPPEPERIRPKGMTMIPLRDDNPARLPPRA